jgi:dTDP-glucose 4,6-dehydratase
LPLNKNFAIGNFIGNVIRGEDIVIKGIGTSVRSYLYMADAAIWFWNILFRGNSKSYDVGSKNFISIKELAKTVASFSNGKLKVVLLGTDGSHESFYVPNTEKVEEMERELGLREYIDLNEAIRRTIESYKGVGVPC